MIELPLELRNQLDLKHAKPPKIGFSNETVLLIDKGYQGRDIVLKTSNRKEVFQEGVILAWFKDKIKVPEVYINKKIDGIYFLVMEKLNGVMMQEMIFNQSIGKGIIDYALLIKQIHMIEPTDFPIQHPLEKRVAEAKYNVDNHLVKTQYFEREIENESAENVYNLLLKYYPKDEDKVIVHGDVCMPNFIYHHGKFNGMIDVGRAGLNDRYLDIAIALRTLRYNIELYGNTMNKSHCELFLSTYGIKDFNKDKFYFYILLDELING